MTGRKITLRRVGTMFQQTQLILPKENKFNLMSNLKASSVGSVSFPATATTFVASASSVFEADPTSSVSVRSEGS